MAGYQMNAWYSEVSDSPLLSIVDLQWQNCVVVVGEKLKNSIVIVEDTVVVLSG